jgi:hypothetical protein
MTTPKKIGELNGRWAALFKSALTAFWPTLFFLIGWGVSVEIRLSRHEERFIDRASVETELDSVKVHGTELQNIKSRLDRIDAKLDRLIERRP